MSDLTAVLVGLVVGDTIGVLVAWHILNMAYRDATR
jgi:hypothetical protein